MREIKFRAWDERNNQMVMSDKEDCFYINTKGVLFMYAIPMSESGLTTEYHKDYKVMQYTGLKDKNGVDIYEGDILSMWYAPRATAKGKVFFDNGSFMFETKEAVPSLCRVAEIDSFGNYITVIGNIYENPELLEDT